MRCSKYIIEIDSHKQMAKCGFPGGGTGEKCRNYVR